MPQVPPWIQPADPAAHYAQGYQIGVHVGAQQAAQAFQQQQLALQQQKELMAQQQQEYEAQMNTQVLNLKAAETARKFQANQAFRARVASGEDPSRVLMELAPDLGESPASILHDQAMRDQQRAMMGFRQQHEERVAGDALARQQQAIESLAERVRHDQKIENKPPPDKTIAEKREKRLSQAAVERDTELKALRDTLNQAEIDLRDHRNTAKGWFQSQKAYDAEIKSLEAGRNEAAKAVDSRLKELRAEYGLDQSAEAPAAEERAGDDTMPDQPATASPSAVKRLRFENGSFVPVQ